MTRALKLLLAVGLIVFSANFATAQDRPRIVTVNYALQYIAERLVDDAADVVFPVPQGVDPSFWRPSVADISTIQSADLILLNGAGFASWIDRVSLPRSKLINTSAVLKDRFIVTESITHSHGDGGEHLHEGLASYTWLDPSLAIAQAEAAALAIASRGLAPEDDVIARLDDLRADFESLDTKARKTFEKMQGVGFIATHPRYQYFANRYDFALTSLEWEAGAMPSQEQTAELAALVEDTGAKVLVWEATPPAGAFEIASELGLHNIVFAPLAHGVKGRTYFEALTDAVAAMSEVDVQ